MWIIVIWVISIIVWILNIIPWIRDEWKIRKDRKEYHIGIENETINMEDYGIKGQKGIFKGVD